MTEHRSTSPSVIQFGEFTLDRRLRLLRRNAETVKLSAKPFDVLEYLIINHDQVVSKEDLLKDVWGEERGLNVVEQTIRQIRLVLKTESSETQYIVTVTGSGYRFVAPLFFPEQETDATKPALAPVDFSKTNLLTTHAWTKYASLVVLGAAGLAFYFYSSARGEPASCEVMVDTLIVKDGQARELWRKVFPAHLNHLWYIERRPECEFADLNGDGVADVLFTEHPTTSDFDSDTLYGFITRSGLARRLNPTPAEALTFTPGAPLVVGPNSDPTVTRPYDEYLPPYGVFDALAARTSEGQSRIAVLSGMNQAPSQIAILDGRFNKTGEYWHTGQLRFGQFAKYHDQDRLFLAGVNNGYHAATMVSFDPSKVAGTTDLSTRLPDRAAGFAILAAGSRGHLTPLGRGTETCRVIFERTCVAKAKPRRQPYNRVISLKITDDRIIAIVSEGEREDTPETVTYEMDRNLNLIEAAPNTKFRQRHFELEQAGLLDHPFDMQELKPLVHVLPGCEFLPTTKEP